MDAILQQSWNAGSLSEPMAYARVRSCTRTRDHFRLLALINLILLPLAIVTFGDRFAFFRLPLSDLGMPRTASGSPNAASFVIFTVNMIASSAAMVSYALTCARSPTMQHRQWKALFALIAAGGFIVGIFPHDRHYYLHLFGCAAMVGSLWFLGNIFTAELRTNGQTRQALLVQLVLQLTVLPYAVVYVIGAEPRQTLQKLAITGLFVSLLLATRALRQAALASALRSSRLRAISVARYSTRGGANATGANRNHRAGQHGAGSRQGLFGERVH